MCYKHCAPLERKSGSYAGPGYFRETEFCRPYGWRDERDAERDAKNSVSAVYFFKLACCLGITLSARPFVPHLRHLPQRVESYSNMPSRLKG